MSDRAWVQPFLEALRQRGKVAPAARQVGTTSSAVAALRKEDEGFDELVGQAIEECYDDIEAEVVRRGKDGFQEPVVYQGALQYLMEPMVDKDTGEALYDGKGGVRMTPVKDAEGRFVPLTINKHSDALLMFAAKGYRKSTFAERTELTGADGKPLDTQLGEVERAARVAALIELARKRKQADEEDIT